MTRHAGGRRRDVEYVLGSSAVGRAQGTCLAAVLLQALVAPHASPWAVPAPALRRLISVLALQRHAGEALRFGICNKLHNRHSQLLLMLWNEAGELATRQSGTTLSPARSHPSCASLQSIAPVCCLPRLQGHPKGAVHVPAFVVIDAPSSPGEWGKVRRYRLRWARGLPLVGTPAAGIASNTARLCHAWLAHWRALAEHHATRRTPVRLRLLPARLQWLACKANGVVPTKANAELPAQIAAAAEGGKAVRRRCPAVALTPHVLPACTAHRAAALALCPCGYSAAPAVWATLSRAKTLRTAALCSAPQVVLACEAGGTLRPTVSFPQGKVRRRGAGSIGLQSRDQSSPRFRYGWPGARSCAKLVRCRAGPAALLPTSPPSFARPHAEPAATDAAFAGVSQPQGGLEGAPFGGQFRRQGQPCPTVTRLCGALGWLGWRRSCRPGGTSQCGTCFAAWPCGSRPRCLRCCPPASPASSPHP